MKWKWKSTGVATVSREPVADRTMHTGDANKLCAGFRLERVSFFFRYAHKSTIHERIKFRIKMAMIKKIKSMPFSRLSKRCARDFMLFNRVYGSGDDTALPNALLHYVSSFGIRRTIRSMCGLQCVVVVVVAIMQCRDAVSSITAIDHMTKYIRSINHRW